jgi:2-polyprenyl-6-methoxyphenol hydroxylase-like FAD-dependent oxidoreductase
MSPIGGVGINLAIQDAVAAANRLAPAFLNHTRSEKDLADIQKRREWPTKFIQSMQVFIQSRVIDQVLGGAIHPKVPLPLKFLQRLPIFRRLTAYLIGVGIRPEKPESRFLL